MAPSRTTADADALVQHPLLTTMGLLAETYAGLGRTLEQRLEAECGLSLQWFDILLRLARTPERRLRMTDLAAQTSLTPSGLTRAVDRLQAAGFVDRQACPTDRRSWYAVLTDAGHERIVEALPIHVAQLEEVVAIPLDEAERATLTELLMRVRDAANPCAAKASEPGGLEG